MKQKTKIIYSILILLSLICMFLPIAESYDNQAASLDETIETAKTRVDEKAEVILKQKESVIKNFDKEKIGIDVELEQLIADNEKTVSTLKKDIENLTKYADLATQTGALDAALGEEISALSEAIAAKKAALNQKLKDAEAAAKDLDKKMKEMSAAKSVEPIDENGNVLSWKDFHNSEYEKVPGVFAFDEELDKMYTDWKAIIDARWDDLEEMNGRNDLSETDEEKLKKNIERYQDVYETMVVALRYQAIVNDIRAERDAQSAEVDPIVAPLDDAFALISLANKQPIPYKKVKADNKTVVKDENGNDIPLNVLLEMEMAKAADAFAGRDDDAGEQFSQWKANLDQQLMDLNAKAVNTSLSDADKKQIENAKKNLDKNYQTMILVLREQLLINNPAPKTTDEDIAKQTAAVDAAYYQMKIGNELQARLAANQQAVIFEAQVANAEIVTVDEAGNAISMKAVLEAELMQYADAFASRAEGDKAQFEQWKATLDAQSAAMGEEAANEAYKAMIMILREQNYINPLVLQRNANTEKVDTLSKSLDKIYSKIKPAVNQHNEVLGLLEEQKVIAARPPIDSVVYTLMPIKFPIMDNYEIPKGKDIDNKNTEIRPVEARLAELTAFIDSVSEETIAANKEVVEAKTLELNNENEAMALLQAEFKAIQDEIALVKEGLPVKEDQYKGIEDSIADYKEKIATAKTQDTLLTDFDKIANTVAKIFAGEEVDFTAVIGSAKVLKDQISAQSIEDDAAQKQLEADLAEILKGNAEGDAKLAELNSQLEAKQKEIAEKEKVISGIQAELKTASDFVAATTEESMAVTNAEKADVETKLAALKEELAALQKKLTDHEAELANTSIKVNMQVAKESAGKSYPTVFSDYKIAIWVGFVLLVLALALVWIPGNKIISKFYTFAAFANLIAVLALCFVIMRLSAVPVAQPYTDPIIKSYVSIPLLLLPIAALLMHCSAVTNTKRSMIYTLCIALSILSLLPFWLMIVNATRNSQQIQSGVSLIPSTFLSNNWNILQAKNFDVLVGFKNSAIIAFGSTLLSVYFSALTAYGLTVYKFKGHKLLYAIILGIIMIPGQVVGTGFYMFMYQLDWVNSYWPLIIPSIAAASTVFFFKQYLEANFQVSLVEAARIDGAGEFYTYNKIVMPIMIPAMATMGIMAVIGSWNNYLTPLMLLSDPTMKTLPMMVKELRGDIYRTEFGSIYLGLTLTALPLMIVYFCFSKYIIAGVAVGGVKE